MKKYVAIVAFILPLFGFSAIDTVATIKDGLLHVQAVETITKIIDSSLVVPSGLSTEQALEVWKNGVTTVVVSDQHLVTWWPIVKAQPTAIVRVYALKEGEITEQSVANTGEVKVLPVPTLLFIIFLIFVFIAPWFAKNTQMKAISIFYQLACLVGSFLLVYLDGQQARVDGALCLCLAFVVLILGVGDGQHFLSSTLPVILGCLFLASLFYTSDFSIVSNGVSWAMVVSSMIVFAFALKVGIVWWRKRKRSLPSAIADA